MGLNPDGINWHDVDIVTEILAEAYPEGVHCSVMAKRFSHSPHRRYAAIAYLKWLDLCRTEGNTRNTVYFWTDDDIVVVKDSSEEAAMGKTEHNRANHKWLNETIANILEDNLHHGITGLWDDHDPDVDDDGDVYEERKKMLEAAAYDIRTYGYLK